MQDDLCEPASDSRTFRRAAWVTAPWGLSGLFHSPEEKENQTKMYRTN